MKKMRKEKRVEISSMIKGKRRAWNVKRVDCK